MCNWKMKGPGFSTDPSSVKKQELFLRTKKERENRSNYKDKQIKSWHAKNGKEEKTKKHRHE